MNLKEFINLEVEIEEEKIELTRSQIEKAIKEHFFGIPLGSSLSMNLSKEFWKELGFTVED